MLIHQTNHPSIILLQSYNTHETPRTYIIIPHPNIVPELMADWLIEYNVLTQFQNISCIQDGYIIQ